MSERLQISSGQLPEAELQRERESIRRGLLRANTAAVVILLVVIGLAAAAVLEANRAMRERARAVQAEQDAREKLWESYEGQARGLRASPQAGHRFDSLEALKKAALIRPSLELRNDAIASLTRADFRPEKELAPAQAAGLAVEPGFKRYAMADVQGRIQVRRREGDELMLELPASTNKVQFIFSFSPDGRYLPIAYENGNTWVWDLKRREVILQFRVLRLFQTVDFSPDSHQLAVAEARGTVVVYELSGATAPKINQSNLSFHGVQFAPDGRSLGIYSEHSNEALITEAATGKVILRLLHPNVVRAMAWHPTSQLIATGCQDHNGYLWKLSQPDKPLRTFAGHQSSLSDVCFHPDGQLLVTSSWDGTTRLWDTTTSQELARITPGISGLQFSPDGSQLAGFESTNTAARKLYEVTASRAVRFLREPEPGTVETYPGTEKSAAIWEVNFSADERLLVSAGKQGLRVWDLQQGIEVARPIRGEVFSAFFHPDGEHLIACGRGGLLRCRITQTGQETHFSEPETLAAHDFSDRAAVSQDGSVLAYGDAGRIFLSGRELSFVGWPNHQWVAVSRDGHWVAASGWAQSVIRLWDVAKGTLVRELPSHNQAVLAFSPDNRWLASGSGGEYCFCDLNICEVTRRLPRPDTPNFQGMIAVD